MILNKKDGTNIEAELKELDLSYMEKIVKLEKEIYEGLDNKEFYACSSREEFEGVIQGKGIILGCVNKESNELIAMGVYVEYGYDEHNYGYDVNIEGEELLKVGQLESTVVSREYRGNKLQKILCEELEKICIKAGKDYICSTVAPDNKFSLNTFINLGYNIIVEKPKYGGLNRYVLMKKL